MQSDDIEPIHRRHHDLRVWREGIDLAEHVHRLVANATSLDGEGLGGRIRETAESIPSEIAAGEIAETDEQRLRYLTNALERVSEFESYLALLRRLELVSEMRVEILDFKISEVSRLLRARRERITDQLRVAS